EQGSFPKSIAPWQPFFDVKGLNYSVAGMAGSIHFEGDQFEMEDQRNWSDASFKTYCTPQSRPKPMLVRPGDQVQQAVALQINTRAPQVLRVWLGRPTQWWLAPTPVLSLPPLVFMLPAALQPLT